MNVVMRIIILAIFFAVSYPCQILADECEDYKTEASRLFGKAKVEYEQKKFEEAIELYERAKRYYRSLSELDCQSNVIEYAKKSVDICKTNVAYCEANIENKKKRDAEIAISEKFNRATKRFNEGNNFAKQRQWKAARDAFKEASDLWGDIVSDETDIGKKAMPRAQKAQEQAEYAEKRVAKE